MQGESEINPQDMLRQAANHLQLALDLLDCAEAPAHIGAHVDLAVNQLEDAIHGCLASPAMN